MEIRFRARLAAASRKATRLRHEHPILYTAAIVGPPLGLAACATLACGTILVAQSTLAAPGVTTRLAPTDTAPAVPTNPNALATPTDAQKPTAEVSPLSAVARPDITSLTREDAQGTANNVTIRNPADGSYYPTSQWSIPNFALSINGAIEVGTAGAGPMPLDKFFVGNGLTFSGIGTQFIDALFNFNNNNEGSYYDPALKTQISVQRIDDFTVKFLYSKANPQQEDKFFVTGFRNGNKGAYPGIIQNTLGELRFVRFADIQGRTAQIFNPNTDIVDVARNASSWARDMGYTGPSLDKIANLEFEHSPGKTPHDYTGWVIFRDKSGNEVARINYAGDGKTTIEAPQVKAASSLLSGPGPSFSPDAQQLSQGASVKILGTYGDYAKISWKTSTGETKEGFVLKTQLANFPQQGITELKAGDVPWIVAKDYTANGPLTDSSTTARSGANLDTAVNLNAGNSFKVEGLSGKGGSIVFFFQNGHVGLGITDDGRNYYVAIFKDSGGQSTNVLSQNVSVSSFGEIRFSIDGKSIDIIGKDGRVIQSIDVEGKLGAPLTSNGRIDRIAPWLNPGTDLKIDKLQQLKAPSGKAVEPTAPAAPTAVPQPVPTTIPNPPSTTGPDLCMQDPSNIKYNCWYKVTLGGKDYYHYGSLGPETSLNRPDLPGQLFISGNPFGTRITIGTLEQTLKDKNIPLSSKIVYDYASVTNDGFPEAVYITVFP